MLPYSRGMSTEEADAIRKFAKAGGLVIGDNTPGIHSRFGRKLDKPRLADMFPVTDKLKIVRVYAPDGKELECFRDNIIFEGEDFEITLPISYSESAGKYTVKAEYAATCMNAQTSFEIVQK